MGIWETFSDLMEAATPWSTAEAEPPAKEPETQEAAPESDSSSKDEPAEEVSEDKEEAAVEPAASDEAEEEEEEEQEEDDDEEEIVDPKDTLEEECKNSKECHGPKHHFDECVERVQDAGDDNKEDCVEEFFHLAHCATQCAAPKLWSKLK